MDKKQQVVSISTKTGDEGQTSLANGERVAKDSLVIEVLGTLDELNSWIGLVVADWETDSLVQAETLNQVQQNLYQLSAVVAKSPRAEFKRSALEKLEKQVNLIQAKMGSSWHGKFLHPGGTKLAARLDVARAVCRRCERLYFRCAREQQASALALAYLNRLSDYLYLSRCYINLCQNHSEKQFSLDK